ncbi:hypothetical protein LSAT2_022928 [Lamellibrachia satsuma]|nr:hypothetical protein LSAT2_022928 [Lamellibrachia satsuma]
MPSKYTRICSEHFITGKPAALYDTSSPDWTPSLRLGYPTSTTTGTLPTLRYARKKHRHERKRAYAAAEALLDLNDSARIQESAPNSEITIVTAVTSPVSDYQGGGMTCTTDDTSITRQPCVEVQRLLTENTRLYDENQACHLTE